MLWLFKTCAHGIKTRRGNTSRGAQPCMSAFSLHETIVKLLLMRWCVIITYRIDIWFMYAGYTGDRGPRGDRGDQGERGLKGSKGDHGERGNDGNMGKTGEKGDKGKCIARGGWNNLFYFILFLFALFCSALFCFVIATRAGWPLQHILITVGSYYLTQPVNFLYERKTRYPEEPHDFRQSLDMSTWFESQREVPTKNRTFGLRGEIQFYMPSYTRLHNVRNVFCEFILILI